ncbi:MAG: hypothetical protein K2H59_01940, partial [Muribaculaceae bacterium]|nr:hypothetical protein [Muribaculaceae bacterium]
MINTIFASLLSGDNNPSDGRLEFESADHIRFQNGIDVSGHNYNCHRKIVIEKNIYENEGYTVTIYNMDGVHPLWGNNIQMSPKQMKIVQNTDNKIVLKGFGTDRMGSPFSDYGISIEYTGSNINNIKLDMFDRNVSILY